MATIHENYTRNEIVTGASDRSFGIVMTAAFTLMSLLNWWHQGRAWRWTIGIAAVFLAVTLFRDPAAQGGKPHRDGFGVLRHGVTDGARRASVREGPLAAQTPAQCGQLLDRATPAWAHGRIHEGPVLRGRRVWIFWRSFGDLCVCVRNSG
jgi:hypothetical protein